MRIRTGLNPGDWSENEPAVGRFHGVAAWGTRGSMVISGTNRPAPTVITKHLRTPETASSKAARMRREQRRECGKYLKRQGEHCARITGHLGFCRTRWALDNAAAKKARGVEV
jgi:hypothetical protein